MDRVEPYSSYHYVHEDDDGCISDCPNYEDFQIVDMSQDEWIAIDNKPARKVVKLESAFMASSSPSSMLTKDPTIDNIGEPRNLNNYVLDYGTTQHMSPRLEDL